MSSEIAIQAIALSKHIVDSRGTLKILHDLNLTIARGETVAIIGASGSGKSTLLSLLGGLDLPTAGQVLLQGIDITRLDEPERARQRAHMLGFVFQNFQLLPHLTARENVRLPLELRGSENADAQAKALLQRVGLDDRLDHTPATLSGGEQQRIALARAFVTQPPIILADEPTGSLDTTTGKQVIDVMFDLHHTSGCTLVLVTHDADLAKRCQRTLILEQGQFH